VYGSVYPLKAALPHLIEAKGSVTRIFSISALYGMPSGSAYCAGKAALANLANLAHTCAWNSLPRACILG
jgi:NAD(P)-dependent dehydrogenase (short-subunit alcohol dehydrogenase family)